ncbi:MAG: ferric reductase-like transmembrane domain-containing protein, partial [Thermoleophilaceae bacterium]
VVDGLHRRLSMLSVVFVAVHVVTAVLDSFAPVTLVDAVVPFASSYRPVWLGLGAVAFDLLVALVVTSLLRARLGVRAWRSVHWLAYACWPFALVHALGSGSDVRAGWMLWLGIGSAALVAVAVVGRAAIAFRPAAATAAGVAVAALALAVWLPSGPLAKGWARKAGTPPSLLGAGRSHGSSAKGKTR